MKFNRSILRVFTIMDYLVERRNGATLSEIALALEEPKSSIYDILVTAVHMKYLRRNKNMFYIGSQTKKVGSAYVERQAILDIISPFLVESSKQFNVSVSLVFLEKDTLNYCFTVHPDDAVLVARQDAPTNLIHASSSGKVLLASLSEVKRNNILDSLNFYKFTDKTISTKEELLLELEKVQKVGYAIDNREYHYFLQCIAAPIYKKEETIAAISFSSLNLYVANLEEMIQNVLETSQKISDSLR